MTLVVDKGKIVHIQDHHPTLVIPELRHEPVIARHIMWRMKQLIREERILVTGDAERAWKDFDVKKADGKQGEIEFVKEESAG